MHLSEFMASQGLSDEDVASAVGRNRATVSRWRRRLMRPDWEAIENIKVFTDGRVGADDWTGPLVSDAESVISAEART